MSHFSRVEVKLDDMEAIKEACKELGVTLSERKGQVAGYYGERGSIEADAVISIPGSHYQVGLVKNERTGNYDLVYDKFSGDIERALGNNCGKLVQSATFHKVARHAKLKGYFITKKMTDKGTLHVELTHY
jgi:Protein of unknown function (DUF1257)